MSADPKIRLKALDKVLVFLAMIIISLKLNIKKLKKIKRHNGKTNKLGQ